MMMAKKPHANFLPAYLLPGVSRGDGQRTDDAVAAQPDDVEDAMRARRAGVRIRVQRHDFEPGLYILHGPLISILI